MCKIETENTVVIYFSKLGNQRFFIKVKNHSTLVFNFLMKKPG
jgi:hypothetical protein